MTGLTWQEMRDRCLEAVEVYRRMPISVGPSRVLTAWPEVSKDRTTDYAPETTNVRTPPSADMIAKADEFTAAASRILTEKERQQMWQWAAIKLSRHATLRGYSEKMGLTEHKYRRQIEAIFQKLAGNRPSKPPLRFERDVDRPAKSGDQEIRSERSARHWMSSDAKPLHRPDSQEHQSLVRKLLKQQEKRDRGLAP